MASLRFVYAIYIQRGKRSLNCDAKPSVWLFLYDWYILLSLLPSFPPSQGIANGLDNYSMLCQSLILLFRIVIVAPAAIGVEGLYGFSPGFERVLVLPGCLILSFAGLLHLYSGKVEAHH